MPKSLQPRSEKPVSEKQLAANRANAAKSTGPKTPEGRSHSSQNARKHGFASTSFTVVRLENVHEVAHLRADLIAVYQPVNSQELLALERMAICQQAILRAARLESGLFSACMNESFGPEGAPTLPFHEATVDGIEVTRELNRNFILADGFQLLARQGNSITLFLRYQAQAERQYRRAVEEFERVKKLRPELPNEPISDDDQPTAEPSKPEPDESVPVPGSRPLAPIEFAPNEPIPGGAGGSACQSELHVAGPSAPAPDAQPPAPAKYAPNGPLSLAGQKPAASAPELAADLNPARRAAEAQLRRVTSGTF